MTAWMQQGACRDRDPDEFFPPKGANRQADAARTICNNCPVRGLCLNYALEHNIKHGIWGGTSEHDRRRIRRRPTRAVA